MGTTRSSESLALARHLRSQRTQTQTQVDDNAEQHGALARYDLRQARHTKAAH